MKIATSVGVFDKEAYTGLRYKPKRNRAFLSNLDLENGNEFVFPAFGKTVWRLYLRWDSRKPYTFSLIRGEHHLHYIEYTEKQAKKFFLYKI